MKFSFPIPQVEDNVHSLVLRVEPMWDGGEPFEDIIWEKGSKPEDYVFELTEGRRYRLTLDCIGEDDKSVVGMVSEFIVGLSPSSIFATLRVID